jgi:uncharacterized protein (TIGR02145 family)
MNKKNKTIAGDGFNSAVEQKPFQKTRDNAKIHKSSRNFKLLATVVCTAIALFTSYGKDNGAVTAIAKGEATITTPAGSCSAPLWGDVYADPLKPFSWWNCGYFERLFNVLGTVTDCDDYNVFGEVTDCNGEPILYVRVTGYLTGDEASTSVSILTNSKGRYRLQFPAYSDVTITVKSSDYGNYSSEVSYAIKGKSAGSWVQKNIKLPCVECFWNGDTAVVINGVTWATRNVDAPGTFVATPENAGMFYQWNRKIGWSSTDPLVNSNGGDASTWDASVPDGDEWTSDNDPSPAGWRVPTYDELLTLLDEDNVSYEWTACNGVHGGLFTDKTTGKSVFLPAAGYRYYNNGGELRAEGAGGLYWSSTQDDSGYAYNMIFSSDADWLSNVRRYGFSLRCVPE